MKNIFYLTFIIAVLTCVCGCVSREGYDVSFEKQEFKLILDTIKY